MVLFLSICMLIFCVGVVKITFGVFSDNEDTKSVHINVEKSSDGDEGEKETPSKESLLEHDRVKKLLEETKITIMEFDSNNDGEVDIVESIEEFDKLFKLNSELIIERGKEYNQNFTHQLVRLSNFLVTKKNNLNRLFSLIKELIEGGEIHDDFHEWWWEPGGGFWYVNSKNGQREFYGDINKKNCEFLVNLVNEEVHSFNMLSINSLCFISSLIDNDQITFYTIYEKLDKLNVFNSNWENQVSDKLSFLNEDLKSFVLEMRHYNQKLIHSINELNSISIENQKMLEQKLEIIGSSMETNNILNMINSYQTYKVNRNTMSFIKK